MSVESEFEKEFYEEEFEVLVLLKESSGDELSTRPRTANCNRYRF